MGSLPFGGAQGAPGVHLRTSPREWRYWLAPWTSRAQKNLIRLGVFGSWPQTLFDALECGPVVVGVQRCAATGCANIFAYPRSMHLSSTFHLSLSRQLCLAVFGCIVFELTSLHLPLPKVFQHIYGSTPLHLS